MGKQNTYSAHIECPTDEEHWFAFFQKDYTIAHTPSVSMGTEESVLTDLFVVVCGQRISLTSTCLIQGTRQQNVYISHHNATEKLKKNIRRQVYFVSQEALECRTTKFPASSVVLASFICNLFRLHVYQFASSLNLHVICFTEGVSNSPI